jgi:peptidoglycan/xylan/chitin deacetylase (PgdA/CDA1 family)
MNLPRVRILMYHLVAPTALAGFEKYTITPQAFSAQMTWLRIAGYHPISFDEFLECRRGASRLPPAPVIITFDDGYDDCFTYAVPILRAHRFPAIFFIVAGLVGKESKWMAEPLKLDFRLMDWGTLAKLQALGFECGSHTLTHPLLAEVATVDCREELSRSRSLLEKNLRGPISHLAYPFGSYSEKVGELAAQAGYLSASTTRVGFARLSDDFMALRRVPVNGEESLLDFACRLTCGLRPRELVGRVVHRLRHDRIQNL